MVADGIFDPVRGYALSMMMVGSDSDALLDRLSCDVSEWVASLGADDEDGMEKLRTPPPRPWRVHELEAEPFRW